MRQLMQRSLCGLTLVASSYLVACGSGEVTSNSETVSIVSPAANSEQTAGVAFDVEVAATGGISMVALEVPGVGTQTATVTNELAKFDNVTVDTVGDVTLRATVRSVVPSPFVRTSGRRHLLIKKILVLTLPVLTRLLRLPADVLQNLLPHGLCKADSCNSFIPNATCPPVGFEFVPAIQAVAPKVKGEANKARFAVWQKSFEYFMQMVQVELAATKVNEAMVNMSKPNATAAEKRAVGQLALPKLEALSRMWEKMTTSLQQTVGSVGTLGTLATNDANMCEWSPHLST
mgnify:CR=1 FL=1